MDKSIRIPVFADRLWRLFLMFCVMLSACATTQTAEQITKAETHYRLGISYMSADQLKEAFIEFQKALQLNPEDKGSFNALGNISSRFREYDNAILYYKRAISLDPDYSDAMNNMGVTYMEMGKWDDAVEYFRMALKNPLYSTPDKAYANLAYAFYKKGDYPGSENILQEALMKYPGSAQSNYVLGLVYMQLDRTNDAINKFNYVVEMEPKYIDAHWELANAYLKTGRKEKAMKHFKIVAENDGLGEKGKKALKYLDLLKE
ncbi:MAG: tetratricopeptide repeat protein [Nitrospirae bacterium]|nr:tetratricopeptide repeat protein [Nitrospirota bacterium]